MATCKQNRSELLVLLKFHFLHQIRRRPSSTNTETGIQVHPPARLTLDMRKGRHFPLCRFMFHFQFHYSFYKLLNVFLKLFLLLATTFRTSSSCRSPPRLAFHMWHHQHKCEGEEETTKFISTFGALSCVYCVDFLLPHRNPLREILHVRNWAFRGCLQSKFPFR